MPRSRKQTSENLPASDAPQSIDGATEPIGESAIISGIAATDFASESPEELGTFSATFDDSGELTNSATVAGSTGKRRGRPPGSKTGSRTTKTTQKIPVTLKLDKLADMLVKIHTGLAVVTKSPEMLIDKSEATDVVNSGTELLEFYDLNPDPKTVAWLNFLGTMGMVYGTRVMAISNRPKEAKKNVENKVVNISGN